MLPHITSSEITLATVALGFGKALVEFLPLVLKKIKKPISSLKKTLSLHRAYTGLKKMPC